MLRFRRMKTLEIFASVHGTVHNHFNQERHLVSRKIYKERRDAALASWRSVAG
jgi:putative transposase